MRSHGEEGVIETAGRVRELWELDADFEEQVITKHDEFIDYHIPPVKFRKGRGKGIKSKGALLNER